ncbi:acyl-CoA synthetase [Catenulispora yoronensis]|uniref:Acyl-CoA synthetase n=1 Tax=Catenulispora yoronensis TaxID=450799 RepID=A0ABN2VCA7_9ACTN
MQFNLADLFESVVDKIPEKEALVVRGARRWTYRELDREANRLAHFLLTRGVGVGDHVGMHMYNGSEYVIAVLACLKIRAVPININYRYLADELRYLYNDANLVAVVIDSEFGERLAAVADRTPKLATVVSVGGRIDHPGAVAYEEAISGRSEDRDGLLPSGPRSADDLYIIYTGGTTGMPKGVMWRHEDIFYAGMAGGRPYGEPMKVPAEIADGIDPAAGQLSTFPVAPLMHGAAQLATFISFNMGQKVVLNRKFDAHEVLLTVAEEKANIISMVGDAMGRPLAEALAGPLAGTDMSSLFVLSSAGAILSEAVREQLQSQLPHVLIRDNFGSTESGFNGDAAPGTGPAGGMRFTVNERTTVYLDEEKRPATPGDGKVGRVAQHGNVPLGYYNDPVKTAETFFEHDGRRWVLLGDLGTLEADGSVSVLGRGSQCINTGGEKVFPEEVEAVLKAHPDVFDAIVAGAPDERFGTRVAAVVQLRTENTTDAELEEFCRSRLSGYKVPRLLVRVADIRRSPSGKPDYPWAKDLVTRAVHPPQ